MRRRNDEAADDFESYCNGISGKLVGALRLQVGDLDVAHDLAQEALARTWERWDQVCGMESPQGWTFRTAFNLAHSHRRRAAAKQRALDRLNEQPGSAAALDPASAMEDRQLLEALRRLGARRRAAVVIRYYADFSVRDTAIAMGCAEGTVKALTSQALVALRTDLGSQTTFVEVHDA